jgi:hypothetical protein
MMTDSDLDNIFKAGNNVSHAAGLRAVFDAGYDLGSSVSLSASAGDPSSTISNPIASVTADPAAASNITTP